MEPQASSRTYFADFSPTTLLPPFLPLNVSCDNERLNSVTENTVEINCVSNCISLSVANS